MRQPGAVLLLMVLAGVSSGCDGFTLFVSTGPLPDSHQSPAPTAAAPNRSWRHRPRHLYRPGNVLRPAGAQKWDAVHPDHVDRRHGDLDLAFLSSVFSTTSHDASVTGTLHVAQGQRYRISVVGNPDRYRSRSQRRLSHPDHRVS